MGGRHFLIYENSALIDQLAAFRARVPSLLPRRIVELGVWSGGSTVLWAELRRPEKLVAVDLAAEGRRSGPLGEVAGPAIGSCTGTACGCSS